MAAITLVGTAVTGLLLLAVVLALARGIEWRSNEIFAEREGSLLSALVNWAVHSPLVWVLLFVVASFGLSGLAVVLFLGTQAIDLFGVSIPVLGAILGGLGLVALAFVIVGTYAAARDRDVSPAGASLAASLVVGSLLLVGIATQLLMG